MVLGETSVLKRLVMTIQFGFSREVDPFLNFIFKDEQITAKLL